MLKRVFLLIVVSSHNDRRHTARSRTERRRPPVPMAPCFSKVPPFGRQCSCETCMVRIYRSHLSTTRTAPSYVEQLFRILHTSPFHLGTTIGQARARNVRARTCGWTGSLLTKSSGQAGARFRSSHDDRASSRYVRCGRRWNRCSSGGNRDSSRFDDNWSGMWLACSSRCCPRRALDGTFQMFLLFGLQGVPAQPIETFSGRRAAMQSVGHAPGSCVLEPYTNTRWTDNEHTSRSGVRSRHIDSRFVGRPCSQRVTFCGRCQWRSSLGHHSECLGCFLSGKSSRRSWLGPEFRHDTVSQELGSYIIKKCAI